MIISTTQSFALNITPKKAPNAGINNENGNDCFFNASMQVLSNIPALEQILNKENYYIEDSIPGQLIAFFNKLRTQPDAISGSKALRAYIVKNTRSASIKAMSIGQHDAQEFLSYLLSTLTEESKPTLELKRIIAQFFQNKYAIANFPQEILMSFEARLELHKIDTIEKIKHHLKEITFQEGNKKNPATQFKTKIHTITEAQIVEIQRAIDAYDWSAVLDQIELKNRIAQEVKNVFEITLQSDLTCMTGTHKSTTQDPAWLLSLPTPIQSTAVSLLGLINNFFYQSEQVDDFLCSECLNQGATRKFSLKKLPQVLVLSPKRFEQVHGAAHRIMTPVASQEIIELDDESGKVSFKLIGVVEHGGGTGGGHYWAHVRDSLDHQWYDYNDSSRNPISIAAVIAAAPAPYIFFYERQMIPTAHSEPIQPIPSKQEPVSPISPEPKPIPLKPEPSQPESQTQKIPIIDETFAQNLKTLQLSTEMKKAKLDAELKKNQDFFFARGQNGESLLHMSVDFLEDLLQRKSKDEVQNLIENKIAPTDNFYNKNFQPYSFLDEFSPETYFKYFKFLVKNFDINAQHPTSKQNVLDRILANNGLKNEINKNDEPYKFDNFIEILMSATGTKQQEDAARLKKNAEEKVKIETQRKHFETQELARLKEETIPKEEQGKQHEKTVTLDQKIIAETFDNIVKKLSTQEASSEKINKLETDGTLNKIKQEIILETQFPTKPLENKDILDLITKKLTHALTQPQDPLSEKLNLLKQRLTMLKTKLGQLRNSLEFLKKALS